MQWLFSLFYSNSFYLIVKLFNLGLDIIKKIYNWPTKIKFFFDVLSEGEANYLVGRTLKQAPGLFT